VVSVALLVWPLVVLDAGWAVTRDARLVSVPVSVLVVSEADDVVVVADVCAAVVPVVVVAAVCGSGVPAKVTTPNSSANVASVAAATRRWMRVL